MNQDKEDEKTAYLIPRYVTWDGQSRVIKAKLESMPINERKKITVFTFIYDNTIIPYGYTIHIIANKIFNNLKEDNIIDGTLLK